MYLNIYIWYAKLWFDTLAHIEHASWHRAVCYIATGLCVTNTGIWFDTQGSCMIHINKECTYNCLRYSITHIPDRRNFSFWLEIDSNEILCFQIYVCWMEEISTDERLPPHISNLFFFHCLHTSDAKSLGTCLCHASTSCPVPWCQVSQHSKIFLEVIMTFLQQ